ncbi:phage tail assembly chaperone family protein, TAC [Psychrobacter sp. 16-MNA-CIBAN-0192]|uniref:phage tail assembly chaperone family protein, TAC n=1 Tax=Psychrobacter sp. 16-MNA-CIBAN-0192 TaxID=3140448 RepID=UPI00332170EE
MAKAPAPKSKTTAFNKAALLAAVAASTMLKPERITIEEAGGDVFVNRMTLGEREQYFEDMKEVGQHGTGNAEAFIYAILNEDGTPMFTRDDVEVVKSLPPELTARVITEFNKINRFIDVNTKSNGNDEESEDLKNS